MESLVRQFPDIPISQESLDIALSAHERYGHLWMFEEGAAALDYLRDKLDGTGRNFIEIGSANGASFAMWSTLFTGKKISVDWPHGCWAGDAKARYEQWTTEFDNVSSVLGKSADADTLNGVRNILGGEQVDFLFIDGDHAYDAAMEDYRLYAPFVRSGGFIGFHDVNWGGRQYHDVAKYWGELSAAYTGEWWETHWHPIGIGIIRVP